LDSSGRLYNQRSHGEYPIGQEACARLAAQAGPQSLDALGRQAFTALTASPAARAYYDQLTDRGKDHNAALRQLANRLVGILHGCLKTNTTYDEIAAWPTFHEAAA